jgi:hypothetical protein
MHKRSANVPFNAFIKVYRSERMVEMMGETGQVTKKNGLWHIFFSYTELAKARLNGTTGSGLERI